MRLPQTAFSFIFSFVRKQWLKFSILIATSIFWAVNDTIFPYFIKRIVNGISHYHGNFLETVLTVKGTLILVAAFWIFTEMLLRIQGILSIYTFPYFRANIRHSVIDYVKKHSHEYFSSNFSGDIAKKIGDIPKSCQTIVESVCFNFMTAGVGALAIFILMWQSKPIFAIIMIVWLSIHLGLTAIFLNYSNYQWEAHSQSVSKLSGKIVDAFSNILNVRIFARQDYEASYLIPYQKEEIIRAKKAMWTIEIMRVGLGLNGLCLILGMLFTLIYGWTQHWVTIGDFTQISMQSFWLLGWIWFISYQLTVFIREVGTVNDALSLVRKQHDLVDIPDAKPIIIRQGKIEFKQVCFAYSEKRVVFKNLNIIIPAGQKVGLVGFSGSGKSTFVNLILRFYDIQSGQILIDDQNIAEVTQDSLRAQIAMIPQEPALFHRTLMENIRYGRLDASDEEVIEAAKLAHCHEFIEKLEEGYYALVGEHGIKLSGGQRQRIAIARAILKNSSVLILDEATSSLDSVTEKLIQESLQILMRNRTTIVIAHRLSTLADMDHILVFDKGQIIEEGTKEGLLEKNGHFSMLWNMQMDGFLPDKEE